jgi:hypothetical protein
MNTQTTLRVWRTKDGTTVEISTQHKDLCIITRPNGKFHTVHSSADLLRTRYPIHIIVSQR